MTAMKDYIAFIQQKFQEESSIDVRQGSMVMDLAIKPLGLFSIGTSNEVDTLKFISNLNNYASMTNDQLDNWASRFFANRIIGGRVFGTATIYFNTASSFVLSASTAQFLAADRSVFIPIMDYNVSAQALASQKDSTGLYFWDISIVSTNNTDSSGVDVGGITSLTGVSFIFASVINNTPLSSVTADETNDQFYTRLLNVVNDRSFYSRRSIYGRLAEQFPFIRSAEIVGAGDPRMERDLVQAIDQNEPQRSSDYFGKYPAAEFISSVAYQSIFPLDALDPNNIDAPFSPPTLAMIPNSIVARDNSGAGSDPANRGIVMNSGSEFSFDQYTGLYKQDTSAFARVETDILYSVTDSATFGPISPDPTWNIGFDGGQIGNYGSSGTSQLDYFTANNRSFAFNSANLSGAFTVQKPVGKRLGIMATGSFTIPHQVDSAETNPMMFFLFAGKNQNKDISNNILLNAFSGIGFAVRKSFYSTNPNYNNVFIVNNNSDASFGFYGPDTEIGSEFGWAIESDIWNGLDDPGNGTDVNCNFEIILMDDLTVALTLWNDNTNTPKTIFSTKLQAIQQEIRATGSPMYGEDFKISMDFLPDNINGTPVSWTVNNLIIADMTRQKPMALLQIDVSNFGASAEIELNARASSIDDNGNSTLGFDAYIWDMEANAFESSDIINQLATGQWVHLDDLSLKSLATPDFTYLTTSIGDLSRYSQVSDVSDFIYMLIVSSGRSKVSTRFSTGVLPQISKAFVDVDYIRVYDESYGMYHAKNKSDVYVTTIRNNDTNLSTIQTFTSDSNGAISLSAAHLPILSIDSIATMDGSVLGDSEFSVVLVDDNYELSSKENIKILVPGYISTSLLVSYTYYANVKDVQDFFDSGDNQGMVGDVLIKHRSPVFLDFTINYSGDIDPSTLQISVNDWFDDNVQYDFTIYDLITFMKSQGVTNVTLPVSIVYEMTDSLGQDKTGSFTDRFSIDVLQFFRLRNVIFNQG